MKDYYFTPGYIEIQLARAKATRNNAAAIDPVKHALDMEDALSALCAHLDVVLMKDVRKRWVIVPANGQGVFIHDN